MSKNCHFNYERQWIALNKIYVLDELHLLQNYFVILCVVAITYWKYAEMCEKKKYIFIIRFDISWLKFNTLVSQNNTKAKKDNEESMTWTGFPII